MAEDEFTQLRRQDLARDFLKMVRDELEVKLRTRAYFIDRAVAYGLSLDEIAELAGLTKAEVLEVLQGRDAA